MSTIDDIEGDARNLKVLIDTITDQAIDFPPGDAATLRAHINVLCSLLWVARDLTDRVHDGLANYRPGREVHSEPAPSANQVERVARAMTVAMGQDPDEKTASTGYADAPQVDRWTLNREWAVRHIAGSQALAVRS